MDGDRVAVLLVLFVFGALLVGVLFIALRRVALWYWRVTEAVDLLRSIDKRLSILVQIEVESRQQKTGG